MDSTAAAFANNSNAPEPVVDDPVDSDVPSDLCLNSDDEDHRLDDLSDLEDNFVELAGGAVTKLDDEDDDGVAKTADSPAKLRKTFPEDKVLMMERFLYGERQSYSDDDDDDEGDECKSAKSAEDREFLKVCYVM